MSPSLLVLLGLGAAAASAVPLEGGVIFTVFDSPKHVRLLDRHRDNNHRFRSDISDADYLYEHPLIIAMKQHDRDELVAFYADRGLNSLHTDEHLRFVLDTLRAGSGVEKVGLLTDLRRNTALPEWGMPITKFLFPFGMTLGAVARSSKEVVPWLLVVNKADLKASDASRFEKIADFSIYDHYVKVPLQDETAPSEFAVRSLTAGQLERALLTTPHAHELALAHVPPMAGNEERALPSIFGRNYGIRRNYPILI